MLKKQSSIDRQKKRRRIEQRKRKAEERRKLSTERYQQQTEAKISQRLNQQLLREQNLHDVGLRFKES